MERKEVDSSMIKSVGFDPKKHLLEVEFTSGRVYHYLEVPQNLYDEFIKSESLGKFFNDRIRDLYPYKRV